MSFVQGVPENMKLNEFLFVSRNDKMIQLNSICKQGRAQGWVGSRSLVPSELPRGVPPNPGICPLLGVNLTPPPYENNIKDQIMLFYISFRNSHIK